MKITMAAVVAVLVTSSAAAQGQSPIPGGVNIDGGWVPCSHDLAIARGLGCGSTPPVVDAVRTSVTPPTADEWASFDPYGSGQVQRFVVRTTDRAQWLRRGRTYRHPYNAEIVIGRTEFRCEELGYGEVCDLFQIGTVTVGAGLLDVGQELAFRLFAPMAPWAPVEGVPAESPAILVDTYTLAPASR